MKPSIPHIILASGSPRRLEILRLHGIEPKVIIPSVDEEALLQTLPGQSNPESLAQELALAKARAIYEQLQLSHTAPSESMILGADTIVYKGVGMMGKPAGHDEAVAMLKNLSNSSHKVVTGVALINVSTGRESSFADTTTVYFRDYTIEEIEEYLATEPPYDKAGSYAIQGAWGRQVSRIEGDRENVIGLPFYRLEGLLE